MEEKTREDKHQLCTQVRHGGALSESWALPVLYIVTGGPQPITKPELLFTYTSLGSWAGKHVIFPGTCLTVQHTFMLEKEHTLTLIFFL